MKLNKKKIVFAVIILAVLIAMILGYTYSKYTQSYEAKGTAAVAKWNFTGEIVSGKVSSKTSTISLVDTIKSDSIQSGKLAPGTEGEFDIVIDASKSEVDIDYDVSLVGEESDKPQNLVFTCSELNNNNKKYSNLKDLFSDINSTAKTISKNSEEVVTYHISWEWPYETLVDGNVSEAEDEQDMKDGQNIDDYNFTVKITGTQVK